jgi:hypothetical protein
LCNKNDKLNFNILFEPNSRRLLLFLVDDADASTLSSALPLFPAAVGV